MKESQRRLPLIPPPNNSASCRRMMEASETTRHLASLRRSFAVTDPANREASLFPDPGVVLTQILVVSDVARSREFWTGVLGAELHREYGGTSVVLRFAGVWLLLVTGGEPTADKPSITFAPPTDPDIVCASITLRVGDCRSAYDVAHRSGRPVPHSAPRLGRRDPLLPARSRRASDRAVRSSRLTHWLTTSSRTVIRLADALVHARRRWRATSWNAHPLLRVGEGRRGHPAEGQPSN